jgi:hypothetical protein
MQAERGGRKYMDSNVPRLPLRNFFAGIAEYAFETRLGVADPPLIDYLVELLTRFVRSDAVYGVRDLQGRRLGMLADLLIEAESRVGDARRQVHRHIGDFTLFWAGVYPEALARLRSQGRGAHVRGDHFVDYCEHGKRSYRIASQIPTEQKNAEAENEVLERISDDFELCVYGLGEIRREWERREPGDKWRLVVVV